MKIHVFPRHQPSSQTKVTHLVTTSMDVKTAKDSMRRLLKKYSWSEGWYLRVKRNVDGLGELFKIEMLIREN